MAEPYEAPPRIPAHLEVAGLLRQVQGEGGFATVLARGEREAGTLMIVLAEKGADFRAFERMPQPDGRRAWTLAKAASGLPYGAFSEWLDRRRSQDPDLWIIELDIPQGERFVR